jgi:hypothetical protein
VEVLVLRGLLTATTSTTFSLHGQVIGARCRRRGWQATKASGQGRRSGAPAWSWLGVPMRRCGSSLTFHLIIRAWCCYAAQALLLAVRTCYNIHLMSRSEVNQTTAKASLTQVRIWGGLRSRSRGGTAPQRAARASRLAGAAAVET